MALLLVGPASVSAQRVAEIQVSPPNQQVTAGERFGFFATAYDTNGSVIPSVTFTWSSSDVNVATVDEAGNVTGVAEGVAQVVARAGDREGTAVVQVIPPRRVLPPAPPPPVYTMVQIEPRVIYLLPSERVRARALGLKEGQAEAVDAEVTWSATDETVISIDQNGNVVGLSPGRTTVQARTAGGLLATAPVEVQASEIVLDRSGPLYLSPGESVVLSTVVPAQEGRAVPPELLTWRTSDQGIVTVDGGGRIVAQSSGTARITASGFFQSRSLSVTVHRTVALLTTAPVDSLLYLPIGGAQIFFAEALASDETIVDNAPLTWRLSDGTVAQFDVNTRTLTGTSMGEVTLEVQGPGPGLLKRWSVRVVPGGINATPDVTRMGKGVRLSTQVDFVRDDGTVVAEASGVTWVSDAEAIASVEDGGVVFAVDWGETTLRVSTPWGASDSVRVRVAPELVVSSNRANGLYRLYGLEASESELQYVYGPDSLVMQEASFASDGSRIAFSSVSLNDANTDIYVMDADGGNVTRVTTHRAADRHPRWTPDGSEIVFQSGRAGQVQIFVMNADGSSVRQLTRGRNPKSDPAVSPDGQWIAYIEAGRRSWDIYLIDRLGERTRRVTDDNDRKSKPAFLADGSLAYLREWRRGGNRMYQVVRRDLANGTVTALSASTHRIADFSVDTIGQRLALVILDDIDGILVRRAYLQAWGEQSAFEPIWEEGISSTSRVAFYPVFPR